MDIRFKTALKELKEILKKHKMTIIGFDENGSGKISIRAYGQKITIDGWLDEDSINSYGYKRN